MILPPKQKDGQYQTTHFHRKSLQDVKVLIRIENSLKQPALPRQQDSTAARPQHSCELLHCVWINNSILCCRAALLAERQVTKNYVATPVSQRQPSGIRSEYVRDRQLADIMVFGPVIGKRPTGFASRPQK